MAALNFMPALVTIRGTEGSNKEVQTSTQTKNFRDLFCERFVCKPEKFESKLFREAMNPDLKLLAVAIGCVHPGLFEKDFEYIRRVAYAESKAEILAIVNRLPYDPEFNRGALRGIFRLRISGRRLVQLANELF